MFETVFWSAFVAGIISACSMPLGALTSLFWQPRKRVLAFLVAFGGGALLAAIVIDLVGNVKEKGHILELIIGSIIGSLFFTLVNQIVNNSGGFLRKPSTLLTHLNQQKSRSFKQRMGQLQRLEFFRDLPQEVQQKLVQLLWFVSYPKGTTLYRQGDPSESLYIIDEGKIDLLDPQAELSSLKHLTTNDLFGKFAFFTGSPHQTSAVAMDETKLAVLSRSNFEELLETSPYLVDETEQYIQGEEIADYLQKHQGLSATEVQAWVNLAIKTIRQDRKIPPAVAIEQKEAEFLRLARQIRQFPVFSYLPQEDLEEIAARLIYRPIESGYAFFQPSEAADRLYLLHQGHVEILYPNHLNTPSLVLTAGDAFGELAFITCALHTVTAIAKTDGAVWVLRRQDFLEVLQQSKNLEESVKTFVETPRIKDYLQKRQNFDPTKTTEWVRQALENMNAGQLMPAVTTMSEDIGSHNNAPMSIWLGLLMDSIPEALTIGAQLSHHPISTSLLAGLFIANYPEALSSSRGMKEQGFSNSKILTMWTSIMLLTGILSAVGSVLFASASESVISLLESTAAGAILTVIAETMLPEAYAKGGSIVGLSTLLGFLVIIVIKSLE
ncbi:MAG: cyclic nucleotide-binding domain-containing protein [Microcoleaceae cyanobacterium]